MSDSDLAKEQRHIDSLDSAQKSYYTQPKVEYPSKKEIEIYSKYKNEIPSKSIFVGAMIDSDSIARGGAFLVMKNRKLFLVTAYHIVPGFNALDTSENESGFRIPNKLRIYFHSQKQTDPPKELTVDLYLNHKRTFFSIPPSFLKSGLELPREVLDIIFLPLELNKLPKGILLDTVNLYDKDVVVNDGDLVSVWGFADTLKNKYPTTDTAIIKNPKITSMATYVPENGVYGYYTMHKSFDGNSGGLVYTYLSDGAHFIGCHVAGVYKSDRSVHPAFKDGTRFQQVGQMITKTEIRKAMEKFAN